MKNNLNVLTYGYIPFRYPSNWWRNIRQFMRNLKYAYQRITRGYCSQDLWNLDMFYSELFYHTLHELAYTSMGYPCMEGMTEDKWRDILLEMAEHFLNTQEYNEDIPCNKKSNELFEKMSKYVTGSYFKQCEDRPHLSELVHTYSDEDAYNKYHEKWLTEEKNNAKFRDEEKDKGFDLMKKYFFNLWD